MELKPTERSEAAIAVGLVAGRQKRQHVREYLEELVRLADTAGAEVRHVIMQERDRPDSATFIGKGKAEEIGERVTDEQIDLVIFDDDLSPVQVRNLERYIKCKIIDRTGLILDIFALRAKTKEAMTQVELAQLQYMLSRLTRQWTHLSKQFGGIGTKGPGETQIETDRRAIRHRISLLKEKLKGIDRERSEQRKHRQEYTRVALAGYTNAGKSTLLKVLSDADVFIEDRLFATLDTTVRKVALAPGKTILLSDTVGFIRKLPPQLVASFKSTLTEVVEADILLHVADVSHPQVREHIEVVQETLKELHAGDKPMLYVFNKIDAVEDRAVLPALTKAFAPSVMISAARNINITGLRSQLEEMLDEETLTVTLDIPQSEYGKIARIHELAEVLEKTYVDNSIRIRYRIDRKQQERLEKTPGTVRRAPERRGKHGEKMRRAK